MIVTDETILRQPCVDANPDEIGEIIEKLEGELKHSAEVGKPGIGLAAPQIGIHKNIAIVRVGGNADYKLNVNLVNCKIAKAYDRAMFESEGCLSYPGRIERTWRYQEIYVVDNLVEPYSFVGTGLFAVAIQHELDHTNGILLPDFAIKTEQVVNNKKIRPNDPCVCGKADPNTGKIKKYKKCCGK